MTKKLTIDGAVEKLRQLAKRWPENAWIFCDGQTLNVMMTGSSGERVMNSFGCVDHDWVIESIRIPSDGGDW